MLEPSWLARANSHTEDYWISLESNKYVIPTEGWLTAQTDGPGNWKCFILTPRIIFHLLPSAHLLEVEVVLVLLLAGVGAQAGHPRHLAEVEGGGHHVGQVWRQPHRGLSAQNIWKSEYLEYLTLTRIGLVWCEDKMSWRVLRSWEIKMCLWCVTCAHRYSNTASAEQSGLGDLFFNNQREKFKMTPDCSD